MSDHKLPSGRIPVAPSMQPTLQWTHVHRSDRIPRRRLLFITALCVPLAITAGLVAQGLTRLIGWITNLAFYGRWSTAFVSPAGHHLGIWVIAIPVIGGLAVGLMARYGSQAIRGHGIPEAMEQVLFNESRIPPRITFLKPLSAAISIGTGGPFGAEGPIIATGGALGSVIGQVLHTNPDERKTLLAAGAAAGMAATFGSPVSAVLLAIELLLFEYRARSFIPVALASTIAAGVRMLFQGSAPVFPMHTLSAPSGPAIFGYIGLGAVIGLVAVWVTRAIYAIEDGFERLPVHWMWWPALGGLAVGIAGYFEPRSLGVGYDNIENILGGSIAGTSLVMLLAFKFVSWSISLGSGTSGGTLAPLFTFGGAIGALIGGAAATLLPMFGMDPSTAALVGMAAIFAGASQAMLASVVFAFETTLQPLGLLPLLGGCSMAYLVARLLMKNSIMTEKIARRGRKISVDYSADELTGLQVRDAASAKAVCLRSDQTAGEVREWLEAGGSGSEHTGFPVLDGSGKVVGVLTRKNVMHASVDQAKPLRELCVRPPVMIEATASVREAMDLMVMEGVGRLPVVDAGTVTGIVTRSDILGIYGRHLHKSRTRRRTIELGLKGAR